MWTSTGLKGRTTRCRRVDRSGVHGRLGRRGGRPDTDGSVADGDRVTLTFDSALDSESVPAAASYAVEVSLLPVEVDSVAVSGAALELTFDSRPATNLTATPVPELWAAHADGTTLELVTQVYNSVSL